MPTVAVWENAASSWESRGQVIKLADDAYRFHGLSMAQAVTLNQRYRKFQASAPCGDLALVVDLRELSHPIPTNSEPFIVDGQYTPILERTPDQLTVTGINFQATLAWGEPMRATPMC